MANDILQQLEAAFSEPVNWPKPRSVIPGFNPLMKEAYQQGADISRTGGRYAPQRIAATMRGLSGAPTYQYDPNVTNAMFQTGVAAPALQEFREETMPVIREGLAGMGNYRGGDAQRIQARALTDLGTNLAAQRAGWHREDIGAERQALESAAARQQAAVPLSMAETLYQPNVGMQFGQMRRNIRQARGAYRLARNLGQHPAYHPGLPLATNLLGAGLYGQGAPGGGGGGDDGGGFNWKGAGIGAVVGGPIGGLVGGLF